MGQPEKIPVFRQTWRCILNPARRFKPGAEFQTRPGDWVMRMRFWGENTREIDAVVCQRLPTRASHPKARSHRPITVPGTLGRSFCGKRLTSIRATSDQGNF
jgi:hypothetical protein